MQLSSIRMRCRPRCHPQLRKASMSTAKGITCIFRAVNLGTWKTWSQVSAWPPQGPLPPRASTLRHPTCQLQLEGPRWVFPQPTQTMAGLPSTRHAFLRVTYQGIEEPRYFCGLPENSQVMKLSEPLKLTRKWQEDGV